MRRWVALLWIASSVATRHVLSAAAASPAIGAIDNANCALCADLPHCTALNGKLLYDPIIGYTREKTPQLEKQGVCEDLDAKTVELSKFGDQFQFKDTPRCRALVWNYHCLALAATTHQRVVQGERVSCGNAAAASSASMPLPPCRSLCVDVADKCVYSHFYRDYLENAPCVKAPWESVPNTTFSRCSIRQYVPPKAQATHAALSVVLWFSVMLIIYWV